MILKLEEEFGKKYYSISEVAQMFQVNPSLIRFWETEFDLIKPNKDRNGERRFTRKDIENLQIVYHLVKEKGFTLGGAKDYLKNEMASVKEKLQTIENLKNLKKFLTDLRDAFS